MEHIGINSEPFLVTNGLRSLNVFDLVIDDIDTIRAGAALGATAVLTETDPTVPAWAKESTKPSYTASEVGALPDNTFIPSNVSDLVNDSQFVLKGIYMGTCETAAATATKVCTVDTIPIVSYDDNGTTKYKPVTGIVIGVKFTNTDTSTTAPKLKVNSCEPFGIMYGGGVIAANASASYTGTANNYMYYVFNGNYWVWLNRSTYQTNTDVEPGRINGDTYKTGSVGLFRTTLAGMTADGYIESIVTSSSTDTSKARNTHGFRLGQMYYNVSVSDVAANTNIPSDTLWLLYTTSLIDIRYSLNSGSTLTAHLPIYLVGTISTIDGLFYLDNPWWTLTLPSTEDGKVYIDIGVAYSDHQIIFNGGLNAWEYKDGSLKLYDSSYSKRQIDTLSQCTIFGLPTRPSTTDFTNGSITCALTGLRLIESLSPYSTNNVSITDWATANNNKKLPYKIVIFSNDGTKILCSSTLYLGTGSTNLFVDSDNYFWNYNWTDTFTKVQYATLTDLSAKQDALTAGDGIAIDNSNTIRTTGIPYGECDSTSTSTAFTATVPGIYKLEDGVCCLVKNGVVTSAANFTLNINGLGAKPSYNNMTTGNSITPTAPTRDTTIFNINYAMLFIYSETVVDGGAWICYRGYDANTNTIGYQVRSNSMSLPATQKFYRYRLLFTSADGTHFVPANTSTSTNATASRTVNQTPIDPFGYIVYYGTTAAVEANARPAAANLWVIYTLTLGYSFNRTGAALTLDDWAPVYIKCAPQADGSAIIDADNPYVQALPSTADGKIYIFLGVAYSATSVELLNNHPVYYHDGTGIRIWTGKDCYSKGEIDIALGNKLDSLVSGTNVKTINNTSILGSGDVDTTELYVVPSNDSTALLYAVNGIILDQNGFNTICENILTALKEGKKLYFEYSIQGEGSVTNYTAVSTVYKELTGQTTEVKFIFDYDLALRWIITLTKLNGATNWTASADEITIQEQILTVTSSGNGNAVTNLSILGDTITLDKDKTFIETESDPTVPSWAKTSTKPSYDYSEIANTPTIPDELSDLADDSTHRLVTDTEKSTWNGKANTFVIDFIYNGIVISNCSKTYAEILSAYNSGAILIADINSGYAIGQLVQKQPTFFFFSCVSADTEDVWSLKVSSDDTWSISHLDIQPKLTFDDTPTSSSNNPVKSGGVYTALNSKLDTISDISTIRTNSQKGIASVTSQQDGSIVITLVNGDTYTIDLNHVHSQYLAKIPYTQTIPVSGLLPNVEYDYGTTDLVNVTLDTTNIDNTVANEWHFFFTAQTANCAVTLPNGVYLGNGYTWNMAAGRMFEVSIKHNIAYVGFCDPPSS